MKHYLILFPFLFFAACIARKQTAYELPAAMLPEIKKSYAEQCEKGERLYALSCGGCHNISSGRKKIIPDFQQEDLKGYALRISNARHENNMPDSLVSEEDLATIMTFLNYKKKSGHLFIPSSANQTN
jgi:hypothetical protein